MKKEIKSFVPYFFITFINDVLSNNTALHSEIKSFVPYFFITFINDILSYNTALQDKMSLMKVMKK
jgi:hypothetical protein